MQQTEHTAAFEVEGIGGIDRSSVELAPGVTVLTGRNATNRTSFLQAVMAVMGSRDVSVKGDVEEATVRMELDGDTWERTFRRDGTDVIAEGEAYLEDPEVTQQFAFLLADNTARQAVTGNHDLHDVIMRPIDTEEIEAEIEQLVAEQSEIDDQLGELEDLKGELPGLEEEKQRLTSEIESTREELRELEAEIDESESDVEETREEKAELEEKLSELRNVRNELEEVRYDIDTQKESLNSLENQRSELQRELEGFEAVSSDRREDLDAELDRLRSENRHIQSRTKDLRSVLQFNEDLLDGEDTSVGMLLENGGEDGSALTDQLLDDSETIACWTCGSVVQQDQIEETLEELRSIHQEKNAEISANEDRISELEEEKRELDRREQRRDDLQRKISDTEAEIERREERLEELTETREALSATVDELLTEVDDLESEDFGDVLDLHKEANRLEFEIEQREKELADVEEDIERTEVRLDEEERLKSRRESVTAELVDLRNRIEHIEAQAVEEFNNHMDAILELLDYGNIERIWIEKRTDEVREGRRKVERSVFELHVVRSTESGTTYEDTVDHLSESEREVTGLVFALAGYLVHELHEKCPFMLLDSLEAIDSERIATLVDYFQEYAAYLVVALLPEDAQALDDDYQRVTKI